MSARVLSVVLSAFFLLSQNWTFIEAATSGWSPGLRQLDDKLNDLTLIRQAQHPSYMTKIKQSGADTNDDFTENYFLGNYHQERVRRANPDEDSVTTELLGQQEETTSTTINHTEVTTKSTTLSKKKREECGGPTIWPEDPTLNLQGNENVTLYCLGCQELCWNFNLKDPSKIKEIRHIEKPLPPVAGYTKVKDIVIPNVSYELSGAYVCSYCNTNENVTYYLNVSKPFAPIILNNKSIEDIEGIIPAALVLNCTIDGLPKPKITWYKDDELLDFSDHFRVSTSDLDRVIRLNYTQPKDSGTYKCDAYNSLGRTEQLFKVNLKDYQWQMWYPLLIAFLLAALIIFVIFMYYKRKYNKRIERELHHIGLATFDKGDKGLFNPKLGINDQVDILPYEKQWEFPRRDLNLGKQIGSGAFGVVLKATAKNIVEGEKFTTVAVKMCKKDASDAYIRALVSELKIMIHMGTHVNIVNLLGACTRNVVKHELFVIVEYCQYGNLRDYLLKYRKNYNNQINSSGEINFNHKRTHLEITISETPEPSQNQERYVILKDLDDGHHTNNYVTNTSSSNESEDNLLEPEWSSNYKGEYQEAMKSFSTKDLLVWAFQVARGMEYLAGRKVLHSDLAARNILLTKDNVVKICDFGLAKSIYKNPTYTRKGENLLPIKWMAVESLRDEVFSSMSDVWSFGIVLWELFALGKTPYPGMSSEEACIKVMNGYRMSKPEYANEKLYNLMVNCWKTEPSERPEFSNLVENLGQFLELTDKDYYIKLNDPYLLMNLKNFKKSDYVPMARPTTLRSYENMQRGGATVMNDYVTFSNSNTPNSELPPQTEHMEPTPEEPATGYLDMRQVKTNDSS